MASQYLPSPEQFYEFVISYFGEKNVTLRSQGSHFIIIVKGLSRHINIPTNKPTIPPGLLNKLLRYCGLDKPGYLRYIQENKI